ncbi:hypothetical protein HanPSC8_Chr12g0505101 [Helianthus annuus]|nr:hypothetical protein HanPSC8_Chr12g0505101 [Helianthus annuus]
MSLFALTRVRSQRFGSRQQGCWLVESWGALTWLITWWIETERTRRSRRMNGGWICHPTSKRRRQSCGCRLKRLYTKKIRNKCKMQNAK